MAYRSIPLMMTETTNCYKRFACEVRSKLPELKRVAVGALGEEGWKQDWSSNLKGKAYADLKRGATPESICVGDTMMYPVVTETKW